MVSNDLPQVFNKKTAAQIYIFFCVFRKELGQIVKSHTTTTILSIGQQKFISVVALYFCGDYGSREIFPKENCP